MPDPDFHNLASALLAAGTAPSVVERTVTELADHYVDLVDAECAAGESRATAEARALALLGDRAVLVAAVRRRPELKSWAWRWPRVAAVFYPVACVAALPAAPLIAGAAHAPDVGRWVCGVLCAALVTAGMLLGLQLSITAG